MTKSHDDKAYSKSKVMIGNLPNSLPLRNIREKFREFGKIVFMEPMKNGCYIKYATERSAHDAIKEMHRRMCFDRYSEWGTWAWFMNHEKYTFYQQKDFFFIFSQFSLIFMKKTWLQNPTE